MFLLHGQGLILQQNLNLVTLMKKKKNTLGPCISSNLHPSSQFIFEALKVGTLRFFNCAVNCTAISSSLDRLCMVCNAVRFKVRENITCYFVLLMYGKPRKPTNCTCHSLKKHGSYTVFKLFCYRLAFVQNKGAQERKYWPRKRNFLDVTREYLSR